MRLVNFRLSMVVMCCITDIPKLIECAAITHNTVVGLGNHSLISPTRRYGFWANNQWIYFSLNLHKPERSCFLSIELKFMDETVVEMCKELEYENQDIHIENIVNMVRDYYDSGFTLNTPEAFKWFPKLKEQLARLPADLAPNPSTYDENVVRRYYLSRNSNGLQVISMSQFELVMSQYKNFTYVTLVYGILSYHEAASIKAKYAGNSPFMSDREHSDIVTFYNKVVELVELALFIIKYQYWYIDFRNMPKDNVRQVSETVIPFVATEGLMEILKGCSQPVGAVTDDLLPYQIAYRTLSYAFNALGAFITYFNVKTAGISKATDVITLTDKVGDFSIEFRYQPARALRPKGSLGNSKAVGDLSHRHYISAKASFGHLGSHEIIFCDMDDSSDYTEDLEKFLLYCYFLFMVAWSKNDHKDVVVREFPGINVRIVAAKLSWGEEVTDRNTIDMPWYYATPTEKRYLNNEAIAKLESELPA